MSATRARASLITQAMLLGTSWCGAACVIRMIFRRVCRSARLVILISTNGPAYSPIELSTYKLWLQTLGLIGPLPTHVTHVTPGTLYFA